MAPPRGRDSPPWYSFDGFTFESTGMATNMSGQVQHALKSTRHIESVPDSSIDAREYDSKLLALVNLCALFKNIMFFLPYIALPDFWQVVCDRWGLLPDYRTVRFLVHMYSGARSAFLSEQHEPAALPRDAMSNLSAVLASLVDEWRVIYDEYFDLRIEAYEYPDEHLKDDLETAKQMWNMKISSTNAKLLRDPDEVKDENGDCNRLKLEDVPYQSSAGSSSNIKEEPIKHEMDSDFSPEDKHEGANDNMDVDYHSDNHTGVGHHNRHQLTFGADLLSQSDLQQVPVQSIEDHSRASLNASGIIQSHYRNPHYTSIWDKPPTVSPLTSPSRTRSNSPLSIEQVNKLPQLDLDTSVGSTLPIKDLQQGPVQSIEDHSHTSLNASGGIQSHYRNPHYTSIWDKPPTVSPLTSPSRTRSNSPLSIDQANKLPKPDLVTSVDSTMPIKDNSSTSLSSAANPKGVQKKKATPRATDKTHDDHPARPARRKALFPNSGGRTSDDGDVVMKDAEDAVDERPEWQKKGYTFPDAEDYTQINGSKIIGGKLTLAGMIRQHMQKEREMEEAELKKKNEAEETPDA